MGKMNLGATSTSFPLEQVNSKYLLDTIINLQMFIPL